MKRAAFIVIGCIVIGTIVWFAREPRNISGATPSPTVQKDAANGKLSKSSAKPDTKVELPREVTKALEVPQSTLPPPVPFAQGSVPIPRDTSLQIREKVPPPSPEAAAPKAPEISQPQAQVLGSHKMIMAHSVLRTPAIADPDSVQNKRVLEIMVAKAFSQPARQPYEPEARQEKN